MKPGVCCPSVRRIRYLPYLLVMVLAGSLLSGGSTRAQEVRNGESLVLQDHLDRLILDRIIKEEAALRREVKEGVQLATRPYTGYLLHQKSLQLVEKADRLSQLKLEKMEVIQNLARMGERFDPGVSALHRDEERRQIALSTGYSGAPILSFNYAVQVRTEDLPRLSPLWISFFRFIFLGFTLLVFALPLIAIQKGKAGLSREGERGRLRVFPIFTVQRPGGHRELFCLPVKMGSY